MGGRAVSAALRQLSRVAVLGGGVSAEREVSLASSRAVYETLRATTEAAWIDVTARALPTGLDPARDLIFPVLHGTFGEDGGIQRLLEDGGFIFAGCDAAVSALCMDKVASKAAVAAAGLPVAPARVFEAADAPSWSEVVETLALPSGEIVLKPAAEGSSVGLSFVAGEDPWRRALAALAPGRWLVEPRLAGYDLTVGVLEGEALGVVGIHPEGGGAYDYAHKYTDGATRYAVPAQISATLAEAVREAAARAFAAVGARDFARVDFMTDGRDFTFLEINTLPGLTATSLLPKSASLCGLDFPALVQRMLAPALARAGQTEVMLHG
ncbi:MAG: D-alanine--D-alanine ligase [Opitutales bacterium]